jgi:probable F420-dependent oxidoreductase
MAIADRTRIGISTPHIFMDSKVDMSLVGRYVRRAEELGYSSLWTQERLTGAPTVIDPLSFLAYIAGQTTKARLGVSVVVLPRHNPIHLAKQTASIDQMSGGRLILGVGLGTNAQDLVQYGLSPERRVRRFIEHVEIIKALWTQDNVIYKGDFYELDGTNIAPKPTQQPHPPMWFGANVEPAIHRALKYANGWTGAGSSGAKDFPQKVALVQSLLAIEGRTQAEFPISKRVYLTIDDNEPRALRRMQEWAAGYYGNADIAERAGVWGSASKIQEKLAEWSELGVDEFILNPVVDVEATMEQLAIMTGLKS